MKKRPMQNVMKTELEKESKETAKIMKKHPVIKKFRTIEGASMP